MDTQPTHPAQRLGQCSSTNKKTVLLLVRVGMVAKTKTKGKATQRSGIHMYVIVPCIVCVHIHCVLHDCACMYVYLPGKSRGLALTKNEKQATTKVHEKDTVLKTPASAPPTQVKVEKHEEGEEGEEQSDTLITLKTGQVVRVTRKHRREHKAAVEQHGEAIKEDSGMCKNIGYGPGKREAANQRVAQWVASGKQFTGGIYEEFHESTDFKKSSVVN